MSSNELPTQSLDLIVHGRQIEADRIVVLDLRRADGLPLPRFDAGAHIDLHLSPQVVRQYSLSNDPAESHRYVIGVLLDAATRGGSVAVHALQPGQTVRTSQPRNSFALHAGDAPALLLAGGIGVTPLKSMMHALAQRQVDFALHYFARSRTAAAFLSDFAMPPFEGRVNLHFDDERAGAAPWAPELTVRPDGHIYICGPAGFIERATASMVERGVDAATIHVEHFAAAAPSAEGERFVVEAVRSGVRVTVEPWETIAQAFDRAGLQVLTSCEQGLCGVCLTRVIAGLPDHRDDFQTEAEKLSNEKITICCSRSRSPVLQLDL